MSTEPLLPELQEALLRLREISSGNVSWSDGYRGCMTDLRLVVESTIERLRVAEAFGKDQDELAAII